MLASSRAIRAFMLRLCAPKMS